MPSQSPSVTALPEGEPLACRSGSCWTLKARQGAKGRALLQRAGPSSYNLSVSLRSTRPGCGSQRLLRYRLHPAGRCPNSSSLFRPLAAVVAVAPSRGASGEEEKFSAMPKPPLGRGGGSASALTERLSPAAAHGQASLRTTSQSRFVRQGRVAAPSVCFAAARILLAAAPTAPPCFRHWRRSSPLQVA